MELLFPHRLADSILMVSPNDFAFNPQTGPDNDFQRPPGPGPGGIRDRAMAEFGRMVRTLRDKGVAVTVLEPPTEATIKTPDAVFPNNWFSTEHDGTLLFYPMLAENRRAEKRVLDLEHTLVDAGYHIRNLIHIGRYHENERILEGTGSMVIDHDHEIVYGAESLRCHAEQFHNFVRARRYREGVLFQTKGSSGRPIYHTNVMMSVGKEFAVICGESIVGDERRREVLGSLAQHHDVIDISLTQTERQFCGNILQIQNFRGEPLIVMSERAYQGFGAEQRERLAHHGELVPVNIDTIEAIGGGSARCMIAEIFLPKADGLAAQVAV